MKLLIIALISIFAGARAAEQPTDLTGADDRTFKAHLGQVVSLRGKLAVGVQGEILDGATPKGVSFYIILDVIPPGGFTYPPKWERFFGHQVRVSGVLKFRSYDRSHAQPDDQIPRDYYYVIYRHAEIQGLDDK